MKAALKYPVFYLAPAEHMVYVFWREENVTTRRLLAEADGWAGQEVVDASGRCYTIRRCREIGPVGLYGRIGPADRRTVRYDTDFEEEVRDCPLPELQAWIAREYSRSEWFRRRAGATPPTSDRRSTAAGVSRSWPGCSAAIPKRSPLSDATSCAFSLWPSLSEL